MNYSKICFVFLAIISSIAAFAWGSKGHELINRAAVKGMPADTPAFFTTAIDRITFLGPEPDRWRHDRMMREDRGFDLADKANEPDHFIDIEYTNGIDFNYPLVIGLAKTAPRYSRYNYILAVRANLEKMQKEKKMKDLDASKVFIENVGFLPYKISELTQTIRRLWLRWRMVSTPKADKAELEQNIIYMSGVLGHYVGDGSNPHHTSVHYNGWDESLADNPNGYLSKHDPQLHDMHGRFETQYVDGKIDEKIIARIEAIVKDTKPQQFSEIFTPTLDYLRQSNSHLEQLYKLEKKNSFNKDLESPEALSFTEERLSAGAVMLRDLWVWAMKPEAVAPPPGDDKKHPKITD